MPMVIITGQSCIAVQRILVHQTLAAAFEENFITASRDLKSGDPADEDTFIGPMISEK
jgi:acyl-CoA reductase-like NAD-dependent aldehyde dehydrogenase